MRARALAPRPERVIARLLTLVVAVGATACEAETCREKRTTFACDEGYTLTCSDLESTADPVCTCAGDRALDTDGACRARDLAGCCACLTTGNADGPCTAASDAACATALDAGQTIPVDAECRASACEGLCWFLVAADAGT